MADEVTTEQNVEETHVDTTDWKAEARKWEKRAKENSAAADELAALKEKDLSELEKLQKRVEKAEATNKQLQAEKDFASWTSQVSEETGVPANLLRGSSLDEIKAHAESMAPYFEKPAAPTITSDGYSANASKKLSTAEQFAEMLDGIL